MLLVLVLVPFALIDGPGARILDRLGLVDRDESFTELYFSDHLALPSSISEGANLAFDFSIHNREGAARTYTWQVLIGTEPDATSDAGATVIDQGDVQVSDDDVALVHIDRPAPGPVGPAVVSVVLVGRDEAIHFPVTVEPAGQASP